MASTHMNQGAWQLYGTLTHLNQGAWQGWYDAPTPPEPPPFLITAIDRSFISLSLGIGIH